MLSNNNSNNLDDLSLHPIQLPTNFHMPTDYDALRQLLEHNHQHHFKTINEMCYGCDKLENDKNDIYNNQDNEDLNEKIEHIQPQNHEHLCSLHALQFYPCLEDNMEIIGELNTYANLDESSSQEKNSDKEDKSNIKIITNNNFKTEINSETTEVPPNNTTTTIPKIASSNPTAAATTTTTTVNQTNSNFLVNNERKNSYSMYIPNDFNETNNNNFLITNDNLNSIKNSIDKQVIDNLIKNHNHDIKNVYNVLDKLPMLNNQKLDQHIISDTLTYSEPLSTTTSSTAIPLEKEPSNVLNMLNIKNDNQLIGNQEYLMNNKTTKVNNLDANSFPSSIPISNNDKIANTLPLMYNKSHSHPIYGNKDLIGISNNNLDSLVKSELTSSSNPIDISVNVTNPIIDVNNSLLNPSLNQSLLNSNSTSLSYPLTTNTLASNITYPNSSSNTTSSSVVPPLLNTTTSLISSIPNTKINPQPILPKTEQKPVSLAPQETKSRFTSVARKVAPPLKAHPPKTYVKNTTIRNKPTAIDPEEKRRRNTEASARFRARKKFTEIMLKQQTHDLSCKCCELEKQLAEAKREIYWLKQLLIAKNQS